MPIKYCFLKGTAFIQKIDKPSGELILFIPFLLSEFSACFTHMCFGWPCYFITLSWAWVYRIIRVLGLPRASTIFYPYFRGNHYIFIDIVKLFYNILKVLHNKKVGLNGEY